MSSRFSVPAVVLGEAYERQTALSMGLVDAITEALPHVDAEGRATLREALLDAQAQSRATMAMLERGHADDAA